MGNHTRNLSSNTVAFACLQPEVATLINDVIGAQAQELRWRPVSKSLLTEILSGLAESESFERIHEDFSYALWPHLNDSARKEKFSKWLKKLQEDMVLSNCHSVRINSKRREKTQRGEWRNLPTLYQPGNFWLLFRAVQDAAMECDLMQLDVNPRRAQVRKIVANWLKDSGAVLIERQKKDEATKPAKPSLPCKCGCPNCQKCAAKAPAPALSDEPVLSVQIQNAKDKGVEIEREMVNLGAALLNFGNKVSVVDNKLNAICMAARVQLKTAVARKEGRGGDYGPNTEARAHGRAGLELAIEGLKDAQRAAEEMSKHQHAAKLAEFARILGEWKVFQNREVVK